MTPPELQIEHELALLDWADLAKRATGNKNNQFDIPSRFEKDKCTCRLFPFPVSKTAQAFESKTPKVSNAILLACFLVLEKELSAYSGKRSREGNDETTRHMNAIRRAVVRIGRRDPDSDSWTREDMRVGIQANTLLNRLQRNPKARPPSRAQPQQRPPWRI